MRDEVLRVFGFIILFLVIALGLLSVVHMIIALPIPDGKGPEWTGAIGTVGALIGTIWLATTQTRRERIASLERARIHAAGFRLRIASAAAFVGAVSDNLGTLTAPQVEHFKWVHEKLLEIDLWSLDELVPLIPLRNRTAVTLAWAADQIKAAVVSARAASLQHDPATNKWFCEHIVRLMGEIEPRLREAMDACRSAAEQLQY